MVSMQSLEMLEDLIGKMLDEVVQRGDISPQEMCTVKEAVESLGEIEEYKMMVYGGGEDYDRFSYGYNSYGNESYANANRGGGGSNYGGGSNSYGSGNSYARSRNRLGQYTSREGQSRRNSSMMSGHSIKDRAKARLEDMMDEAKTDYERQELMEMINMVG